MHFKQILAISMGLLIGGALPTFAKEYQIDLSHSELLFKVRHMGINTVTGRFDAFTGGFSVDPKNVGTTKGTAIIEAKSINTNNQKRDDHLRGDDFFNVEKFPQIKFVSKSVRGINMADSTSELVGDLTLRDITKEIVLKVKGGGIMNDDWGNERAAFVATGKINRFDFGLKWNKLIEAGGVVLGPEVELALSFEGVRPSAPKPVATPALEKKSKAK